MQLAIDENAHRLRPVGGDPNKRAREVPKRLARQTGGGRDALRDVAVDADAGRVHEHAPVHLADIDRSPLRRADEAGNVAPSPRVTKRTREIVPRADRVEGERGIASRDAVRDLVRGAVATHRDDDSVTVRRAFTRESSRFVRCRGLNNIDTHPLTAKLSCDPRRDTRPGTVSRDGVDDGESAFLRLSDRAGHTPAGDSALRIASCSSSDSACFDRPAWTDLAKMRVSARP